jgi:sugar phosphate isomerase/epimerase
VHSSEKVRRSLGLQVLFDFPDITEAIAFAADNGFACLELNLGNVKFSSQLESARERKRIRETAGRLGVRLALHAIDGPSFFIPSDKVRACSVSLLKQELDWAESIGAENVVFHLGFDMGFGMDGDSRGPGRNQRSEGRRQKAEVRTAGRGDGRTRYTHQQFPDYYAKALSAALAELKAHARGRARLCIENVGGFRYEPTLPIVGRLLGGDLGLCFDVGHLHVIPPDKRKRELAFFKKHIRRVFHSHIHDNSGLRDEHSALGKGRIDFLPFFRMLAKTDAMLVFEVRPKESALASRDYYDQRIAPRL